MPEFYILSNINQFNLVYLVKRKLQNEKQEPVMVMMETILEIYDQNNISFNVGLLLLKINFSLIFFSGMKYPIVIRNTKVKILFKKIFIDVFGRARSQLCHAGSCSCGLQALGIVSVVCGIQFYQQGSKLSPLHWKHRVLTTGSPGKSQDSSVNYFRLLYLLSSSSLKS